MNDKYLPRQTERIDRAEHLRRIGLAHLIAQENPVDETKLEKQSYLVAAEKEDRGYVGIPYN